MTLQEVFITNLRRIRREKKITQEQLAELYQTDTSYIGQIEIGKRFPSIQLIEKIAKNLDIPAYILFMDCEDKNSMISYKPEELRLVADNISEFVKDELTRVGKKQ